MNPSDRKFSSGSLSTILKSRETAITLVFFLIIAITAFKSPSFISFSGDGMRDLLLSPSLLVILAVGQAVVIISGNVDVSVGSIMGFSAYLTGRILTDHPSIPVIIVIVLGILLGTFLGVINGVLVALMKIPAIVITLGTLYIFRGLLVLWAGGTRILPGDLPAVFVDFGDAQFFRLPILTMLALVITLLATWFMRSSRSGRTIYAIGSNAVAAKLYGLKVNREVIFSMAFSGTLAGFAGVLYLARYGGSDSQSGVGWELQAIAAVVIGGVAILGGSGSVWGAAIGAVLLVTLNRALPVLGIQDFWQQFVIGLLIILAIFTDRLLFLRQSKRLLKMREVSHEQK